MQQDADFINADFLYMFWVSRAHHQEYKILTRQPPVQVVMVAGGSSLRHMVFIFVEREWLLGVWLVLCLYRFCLFG